MTIWFCWAQVILALVMTFIEMRAKRWPTVCAWVLIGHIWAAAGTVIGALK